MAVIISTTRAIPGEPRRQSRHPRESGVPKPTPQRGRRGSARCPSTVTAKRGSRTVRRTLDPAFARETAEVEVTMLFKRHPRASGDPRTSATLLLDSRIRGNDDCGSRIHDALQPSSPRMRGSTHGRYRSSPSRQAHRRRQRHRPVSLSRLSLVETPAAGVPSPCPTKISAKPRSSITARRRPARSRSRRPRSSPTSATSRSRTRRAWRRRATRSSPTPPKRATSPRAAT